MLDKKNKKSTLESYTQKIVMNQPTIASYEKKVKLFLFVGFVIYCFWTQRGQFDVKPENASVDLTSLTKFNFIADMKLELVLIVVSTVLFVLARRYNEYLDEIEERQAAAEHESKKDD